MSPEAQRIAIAKACGWVYVGSDSTTPWYLSPKDAPLALADPRPWREIDSRRRHLPDYLTDLNACHEMEQTLYGKPQWRSYVQTLYGIVNNGGDGMIHATTAQRCEAFLRTLNKWDDTK